MYKELLFKLYMYKLLGLRRQLIISQKPSEICPVKFCMLIVDAHIRNLFGNSGDIIRRCSARSGHKCILGRTSGPPPCIKVLPQRMTIFWFTHSETLRYKGYKRCNTWVGSIKYHINFETTLCKTEFQKSDLRKCKLCKHEKRVKRRNGQFIGV